MAFVASAMEPATFSEDVDNQGRVMRRQDVTIFVTAIHNQITALFVAFQGHATDPRLMDAL
jgi:hypothetical protein